jgi:hypothetical protein
MSPHIRQVTIAKADALGSYQGHYRALRLFDALGQFPFGPVAILRCDDKFQFHLCPRFPGGTVGSRCFVWFDIRIIALLLCVVNRFRGRVLIDLAHCKAKNANR